jgi:Spy/CpxP family protein refolding chaperone
MKKLQCLQCFLLTIIIAGVAFLAPAQQNGGNGITDRFFPALGRLLTDDQRQSLRDLMAAQRDQLQPLEKEIRTSRQALLTQITSGQFDENLVRQYAGQSAKAESELTVIFAKALSQMQPPLSAQQIRQLKNFQPGRFQDFDQGGGEEPQPHLKLPPPLPRDTNDLPMVQ